MRIAEPGYENIVLAVADNQRGRAVKEELILLHRMNAILRFRSASLHESRRAFGLRIGERDLSGVTLDGMPFDSPLRHFASFSSHPDDAADDPFVDARGEVVDFDPSAESQVKST